MAWTATISASRRETASATTFVRPGLYSRKIKAQKLAYPMMLGNGCQALIEDEFQGLMIRADDERAAPKVRGPMTNCLGQANQLPLVCSEAAMSRWQCAAEERNCPIVLVKNRADARSRSVAFHDKTPGEVREGQHRRCGERALQRLEGRLRRWRPLECVLL